MDGYGAATCTVHSPSYSSCDPFSQLEVRAGSTCTVEYCTKISGFRVNPIGIASLSTIV